MSRQIGRIGNYYGSLEVKEENGVCYWGIANWNGTGWEQIPQYLYDILMKFEDDRLNNNTLPEVN